MNKKLVLPILLGIVTLLVVIIGAAYAYFSVNTTNTDRTSTTAQTADNVGTVSLSNPTRNMHIALKASNMSNANKNAKYYATDVQNKNYDTELEKTARQVALATVVGGTEDTRYKCTFNLNIAINGDMASLLSEGDAEIIFSGALDETIDLSNFEPSREVTMSNLSGTSTTEDVKALVVFNNKATSQNDLAGKTLNIELSNSNFSCQIQANSPEVVAIRNCYTDDYVEGKIPTNKTEYVDDFYTYRYNQHYFYFFAYTWIDATSQNGWGVGLTNSSTDPGDYAPCTYINDKPVVSTNNMFAYSKISSIDTSKFNTSNVTDMAYMFWESEAATINLSRLDTSNVTDMSNMFYGSKASTLNLSSFNTSNVANMSNMFYSSKANTLNLSSFNTSNVTNMSSMFGESEAATINLSSFDTSKVTSMAYMFSGSNVTHLDLSSFDLSSLVSDNANILGDKALPNLHYLKTPKNIPASIGQISLNKTFYDEFENEYTVLDSNTPTKTMLYDSKGIIYDWQMPNNLFCEISNNQATCDLILAENTSYEFNTDVLSAAKLGTELNVTTTNDSVLFDEEKQYQINYSITDTDSSIKSATLFINIICVNQSQPRFEFKSANGNITPNVRQTNIDNLIYIMPDVNDVQENIIGSVTIDGNTIYAPIVNTYSNARNPYNIYYPVFKGISIYESVNNNVIIYSTNTDSMPNKLTWIGFYNSEGNEYDPVKGKGMENYYYSEGYDGLYRKSNDINSNTSSSTYYVKYSYAGEDGNVYYYFIGYKQAAYNACLTGETLITLADGTKKMLKNLTFDDKLLVWNFMTGDYDTKDISILVYHGKNNYTVNNLKFSDGTILRTIGDHGVFDYDLNKYVYIREDNYKEYLNHQFAALDGSEVKLVKLVDVEFTKEYTGSYSISSSETSNAIANGMLTVAPPDEFYNWIDMDGKMRYNTKQLEKDIEKYGLYTYEDFKEYVTEKQYKDFNGAYLKIPVEKGYFTFEYILELINEYKKFMP